ncbi:Fic family protein [Anaerosinus massiliensis]|uniref:Fic family protein n=1 Tax=Massilibacillus massiliensis TaxID=1806837 RepID=UPI000AFE9687|nr:Fic family protein [Massilibacillus massiliensis]
MDFTKIDDLQSKLKAMRPLNPAELSRLRNDFIIENTYNSNAIEGNTLTLRETALILQEGITIAEKPVKEHLEVIGHKDAFEYILTLADSQTLLTEKVIQVIHSLVLISDASSRGIYRRLPVTIMGAMHTPPQPDLIPVQMEQLLADYTSSQGKHIIETLAEFHLRFEGIHPFIDGNGRTGRLILNLELIKAGLLPINIKFADRRKYYECFDCYYGASKSAKTLIELIIHYEIEEIEKYLNILI